MHPLLSFLALRHDLETVDPLRVGGLSRAAPCHVRGLVTPIAASTTVPPGARSAGAPMGFSLRGLTASRRRPFRDLCPLDVSRSPTRRSGPANACAFRALFSRRSRRPAREGPPPNLLGILPSRAFSPVVRAVALCRDADPHTLGEDYVFSSRSLRASRIDGIGWSVSGLPALLGFRTFRPSRRSAHRPGQRAHGFASRGRALAHAPRAPCHLGNDATEDPGPSARRRRPCGARRAASSIRQEA